MATNRATKSGINADVEQKREKDYDRELEVKVRKWMETVTDEPMEGDFFECLQDGSYLCRLFNKLFQSMDDKPIILLKHTKATAKNAMSLVKIDKVDAFLKACKQFGMDEKDLFVTLDLVEYQNKNMVLSSIVNLGRHVQKINPDFKGPLLGPKEADHNPRFFDEQKTREGRNFSSLLTGGTNQVASQGGMTPYGMGRQVYDPKI